MLNYSVLQGRLCADPELRQTGNGISVCSFRVAWSEKYKDNETKLFLNCTAWRSTGEMVSKYFSKGKEIIVEGKISTRDWEDKEGNKRSTVEMTVERVSFCGPKDGEGGGGYTPPPAPSGNEFGDLGDDDGELPF